MSTVKGSIPEEWIKQYVDSLIEVARMYGDVPMGNAVARRAEVIIDMVNAYRERNNATQPAEGEGEGET